VEPSEETLSVEVPEPTTELGLKLAVAPVGKPLTLSDTVPLNPATAVTVAV
jgi:hypothetical protein